MHLLFVSTDAERSLISSKASIAPIMHASLSSQGWAIPKGILHFTVSCVNVPVKWTEVDVSLLGGGGGAM